MSVCPLCLDDVEVTVQAEPDWTPVRGNALASGDDDLDKATEDAILERLREGDSWAWTAVTVTVHWEGITGSAHLGCCSYTDEEDFRQPGGYYDDLVAEALADLNHTVDHLHTRITARLS